MRRALRLALTAAAAAAALPAAPAPAAAAGCALGRYRIEGSVTDRASGRGISGARVLVFLDDDSSPWREAPRRVPDHARTDEDGRFESSAIFATDAPPEADAPARCDVRPRELEVVVTKEGAFALRQRFEIGELERAGTKQEPVLRLPTLQLELPGAAGG
jgi:hypothetical protein